MKKRWMMPLSSPPTNPIVPVLVVLAAIQPTRNEPSQSLVTVEAILGANGSGPTSTIPNFWSGNALATVFIAAIMSNDEPMMMSGFWPAARASDDWKLEITPGWITVKVAPRSFLAAIRPSYILSLNE